MKLNLSILTVALALTTGAKAETGSGYDVLSENGNRTAKLEHCKGYADLDETYADGRRLPVLKFRGIQDCSIISIDGVTQREKIERRGGIGYADVTIFETPGRNEHTVTLRSGSGATSDTVRVISYGERPRTSQPRANITFEFGGWSTIFGGEQSARLRDCGGLVTARLTDGDTLTLVFSDVQSCSKFDILSADGDSVNYPQKSLQANRRGDFAGSFTIPRRYIDAGRNSVKVILKSNSGKTDEVILIRFTAL